MALLCKADAYSKRTVVTTMAKPTRTTNRIVFTHLAHERFEDLCLAMVYPLHPWIDIRHYGRSGGDGGVDILAEEGLEDGKNRQWYVQCRRYKTASKSTLRA